MKTFNSGMNSDTNPKDLQPSEPRYMPNIPDPLQITNLTVKDLGDIVEASFQSEGCSVVVQMDYYGLHEYDLSTNQSAHNLHSLVESYLKE